MELWFSEYHSADVKFSLRVRRQLFSYHSDVQHIQVLDSYEFGRVLVLDGEIMLTEKDEFIYHEMLVHVPMGVASGVKRALIIGGGDGGALRELSRYPDIEEIVVVEVDPVAIRVAKRFLPTMAASFDDPRVKVVHEDGLRYVRRASAPFDLIIVDSIDPFGVSETLYSREFYGNCYRALSGNGVLVNQHEGPYYREEAEDAATIFTRTSKIFPVTRIYLANIPTYPGGNWMFGFMSKGLDPVEDYDAARWLSLGIETRYYNPELHRGAFALPTYVKRLLEKGEIPDDVFKRVIDEEVWPPENDHEHHQRQK